MYVKGHQDEKDNICFLFCDRCFVASTGVGGGSGASVGNLNKTRTLRRRSSSQNTDKILLMLVVHSDLEYTEIRSTLRQVEHPDS